MKLPKLPKAFKLKTTAPQSLEKYYGKTVKVMSGEMVTIEKILPSFAKPTRYEINGEHHVVMLDFYKQMNNDKSITQADIDAFDKIEYEVVRKPTTKSLIEVQ